VSLSPAAQAVRDAFFNGPDDFAASIAAALCAAADQVVPEQVNPIGDEHDDARHDQWMRIRWKLIAIAAELESGQSTTTRQYYYQSSNCPTVSAQDARCTCWHDEGTGPLADETEHRSVCARSWRDHPTPPRENI
jgi:hypothetical protein